MKEEKDEILYSRYLSERNEADLRILLERYNESLTLFLYGIVHNMEDAEELMLDAFAAAAAGRSPFAGKSTFKTWLFSIGHKLALMHLRKNRIRTVPFEEAHGTSLYGSELADFGILEEERNIRLYQALDSINPEYRQVLYLLYFEEMKVEEICRVMKKNRKQIYNLADRGRRALKEKLGDVQRDLLS